MIGADGIIPIGIPCGGIPENMNNSIMVKKILVLISLSIITFMSSAQNKIRLSIGDKSMTATLVDNTATRELQTLLQKGPITIQMNDYGGFEKVGMLPQSFTTSNTQIRTVPGDIMLYQGNNLVIFYGSNSWSYTRLGKIDEATSDDLRQFLETGSVSLNISLDSSSGIDDVVKATQVKGAVYNLKGNLIKTRPLPTGLYIINAQKTLVR